MSVYDDYMKSVLGYDTENYKNTYRNYNDYMDYTNYNNVVSQMDRSREEAILEECYPDIYKIVYPMVRKACMKNTKDVSSRLVDEMTNEIYFAVEDDSKMENRESEKNKIDRKESGENKRQIIRNQGLNDLIRILILRELLNRPGFGINPRLPFPPRPPMYNPPPRPPRPPRYPFNRSLYEQDYDLYE